MNLSKSTIDEILKHVEESLNNVNFGSIEIEINATSDKIDIIVKDRKRFVKKERIQNGK